MSHCQLYTDTLQAVPLHDQLAIPLRLRLASSRRPIIRHGTAGQAGCGRGPAGENRAVARSRPAADNVPPTARRRRPTYDWSGGRPSALGRDSSRAQNDPMRFLIDDLTSVQRATPTRPNNTHYVWGLAFHRHMNLLLSTRL